MTLYYIANIRLPTEKAHGVQIMKMCEAFSGQGVTVELIVPTRKNALGAHDPFQYYEVKKTFVIRKLRTHDPRWALLFPGGIYIKVQSFLFGLNVLCYCMLRILKNRDCVLYTRDELLLFFLLLLPTPTMLELHALPRRTVFLKRIMKRCTGIITLTACLKQKLIGKGILQKKLLVAADAVDLEIFDVNISRAEAQRSLHVPLHTSVIGYSGSYKTKHFDKGISSVFSALKILREKGLPVLFLVVGGSNDDIAFFQAMVTRDGINDLVRFVPRISPSQLAITHKAFDICIMPFPFNEHFACYMSPMKMFEYMASKRSIIATDLPAVREVLNSENAVLVPPGDPGKLAGAIELLIRQPAFAEKIALKAFRDVQSYTWRNRASRITTFITSHVQAS